MADRPMPYALPSDVDQRHVLVIGAGTFGARIALMFAAGGSPVRIWPDPGNWSMAGESRSSVGAGGSVAGWG